MEEQKDNSLKDSKYFNRDLSWLQFNHRVLQEATDRRNPLYERIKFLAIFSSNLDEFFAVRVSNIRQIKNLDKSIRKKLITKPNRLLKAIKRLVYIQLAEFQTIFMDQIIPELAELDVILTPFSNFTEKHIKLANEYFMDKQLEEKLIIDFEDSASTHTLEKDELYLVTLNKDDKLIWVKTPSDHTRFVSFDDEENPDSHQVFFIDDIIKNNLSQKYGTEFFSIVVSRDAELYIDNEYSGNLLEKIENSLSKRETGQITGALIDRNMPTQLQERLIKVLDISKVDFVKKGPYQNMKDLFGFPKFSDNYTFENLPPKRNEELACLNCLFSAIAVKDRILSFPYESFEEVTRLVEAAAEDELVTHIKITLYRVSANSAVANALLKAVDNGKDVCAFIETKARFDEANNIKWGKKLEEKGANIIYSYPGIKVHSKILYIRRIENDKPIAYAYIGTGNFNEKTATIYTDLGLMTSNEKITSELLQVFSVLERKLIIPNVKNLLVSPFNSRTTFSSLVQTEIEKAKNSEPAKIVLKLNSLQDRKLIKLLYKASRAGVEIRLLVRGICCLVPGIEGQSENIYITSIVDRFLEHSRVYIFGVEGREKMYIGSADWMTRNIDHRIEVITPILSEEIFSKIKNMMQLQLDDAVKARVIDSDQKNEYVSSSTEQAKSSQHLIYQSF